VIVEFGHGLLFDTLYPCTEFPDCFLDLLTFSFEALSVGDPILKPFDLVGGVC